jgi:exodeoxyribonuclease VII small subunit
LIIVTRKKPEPFEDALKKLEKIVDKLERGSLPLEEAMEAYTEGVRLVKYCNQKLDQAESTVQILAKDEEGSLVGTPFDPVADNDQSPSTADDSSIG